MQSESADMLLPTTRILERQLEIATPTTGRALNFFQ